MPQVLIISILRILLDYLICP